MQSIFVILLLYFLFDQRSSSFDVLEINNNFVAEYKKRYENKYCDKNNLNFSKNVIIGLNLQRGCALHSSIIIGSQQNDKLKDMTETRSVILESRFEWKVEDKVNKKNERYWKSKEASKLIIIF